MEPARTIGTFTGQEDGPLLICIGGMHGNEPAGIQALKLVFNMLEIEPIANPNFTFRGRLVGLRGNLGALQASRRFVERDLNRMWTSEIVSRVQHAPIGQLHHEERELRELLDLINRHLAHYQPEEFVLLDLHTTTAGGGIFTVVSDSPRSINLAVELHAPVIKGMLRGISGTMLHYFNDDNFPSQTTALAFEAGQHNDPLSVNRSIAAIINCLRSIGCVQAHDVENRHDELLIDYSRGLPKVSELIMTHPVHPDDHFFMIPNFQNFQAVRKGELLARDRHGSIVAPADGRILMPLYQPQGEDGFFLIKDVESGIKSEVESRKSEV